MIGTPDDSDWIPAMNATIPLRNLNLHTTAVIFFCKKKGPFDYVDRRSCS